jgi:hypothetical protein
MIERGQPWAISGATAATLGTIGLGLIASYIGAPIGITLIVVSGVASGTAIYLYEFDETYGYIPPFIFPYDLDKLNSLGVYSFEIAP